LGARLGGRPDGCQHQIGVEPAPVRRPVVWVVCKQTQQRLHASAAADICLASRLVRLTSCALSALLPYKERFVKEERFKERKVLHYKERFVVSGYLHPAL